METSLKERRFLELLEKYRPQIYRICYGFTDTGISVEDLFQEATMKIWRAMDQFRGEAALSTFAYRITVNTCIYWKRKNDRKASENQIWANQGFNGDDNSSTNSNSKLLKLRKAIQQLNKVDRSIILLLLEECSYKEIAEVTGLSVNHVGVKISRVKARLKTIMEKIT